jgi:hypothetical protein
MEFNFPQDRVKSPSRYVKALHDEDSLCRMEWKLFQNGMKAQAGWSDILCRMECNVAAWSENSSMIRRNLLQDGVKSIAGRRDGVKSPVGWS